MKRLILIISVIVAQQFAFSQVDTSLVFSQIRQNDTIIENASSPDTMLKYANKSLFVLSKISSKIPKNIHLKKKAEIFDQIAVAKYYKGDLQEALEYFTDEIKMNKTINNKILLASAYNNIGLVYSDLGDKTTALEYYFKALAIDKNHGTPAKIATRYNNIGNIYLDVSEYNKAIDYFEKCIDIYIKQKDTINIYYSYNNIASAFRRQGKYNEALQYFNFALRVIKQGKDYKSMATCLSNIGVVYQDWGRYNKALEYFKEAIVYDIKSDNKIGVAIKYNNIASAYKKLEFPDSAVFYFTKSKEIFEEKGLLNYAATVNSNIGNVYVTQKKYQKALDIYFSALKIAKSYKDYSTVTKTYSKIGNTYSLMGENSKAVSFYKKSVIGADSLGILPLLSENYKYLSDVYTVLGDNNKALGFLNKYISVKDSIFSKENLKQINEFDIVYQTIKKEGKIKLLEKEKAIDKLSIINKNTTVRNQRFVIFAIILGFIFVIIFMFLLLKQIKAKKRANYLLVERNEEINQQKEEITAQRDEITHQKDVVETHLELIENQKKELTDSIEYAKHIQQAVLLEEEDIKTIFPNSFIYYQPKDIISGDFYWFKKYESKGKTYRAIASVDSTGHGVPGALMSMLGISFLSDVFSSNIDCVNPSEILNKLRERVILALKQKGKEGEAKDGFDMSLCVIDDKAHKLYFSGANSNIKILRNNNLGALKSDRVIEGDVYSIYEFKGDRMPISITRKGNTYFTSVVVDILPNDSIYLMSDGYVDQFGGENSSKFKSKKLNDLLLSIQDFSFDEKKIKLIDELEKWRNFNSKQHEQTDDILFIGFKF